MGKTNKQAERSKRWLIDALFQLMKKQPFQKISITEITDKAGVSRLTYYRNFTSKEEMILAYFDQEFDEFFKQYLIPNRKTMSLHEGIESVFTYWRKGSDKIELLMRDGLTHLISTPFQGYLQQCADKKIIVHKYDENQRAFMEGGMFFLLLHWVKGGCLQSPDELATLVESMLKIDLS